MEKKKFEGFTTIELLLVLVVMAAIAVISFRKYIEYERQTKILGVKNDVAILMNALMSYYKVCGCDPHGNLNASCHFHPDIISDLHLTPSYQSRLPIVKHYAANIVDSGLKTKDNKPIYILRIFADLNSNYSKKLINWYRLRLEAGIKGAKNSKEITWSTLADIRTSEQNDALWIMKKSLADFRRDEMIKTKLSDSYCAW